MNKFLEWFQTNRTSIGYTIGGLNILNGILRRDESDDKNIYRFLKLLHQNGRNNYSRVPKEINE